MKKNQLINVRVYPKTSKKDSAGQIPLYLKITIDYEEAELSLNAKICSEQQWDPIARNVSHHHPQFELIHTAIAVAKERIVSIFKELIQSNETVTSKQVKENYLKRPDAILIKKSTKQITLTLSERVDQAVTSMIRHCQAVVKEEKEVRRQFKEQRLQNIADNKKKLNESIKVLVKEATIFFDNMEITKTLIHCVDELLLQLVQRVDKNLRSFQTLRRWQVEKNKIKSFLLHRYNENDIKLDTIRFKIAEQYYDFLTIEHEIGNNTAMKHVKSLKQVIERSVSNGWLVHNPLRPFKCTYEEPNQEGIVMHDIHKLINTDFGKDCLNRTRDVFIFGCFTGYAYQDIAALSPSHIITGIDGRNWFQLNRGKTGGKEDIPILKITEQIIEKYKNDPYCKQRGKLIPVLSNSKYNRHLKEIAIICGIKRDLTTHVARHTFATTITLENDVPLATVQKMLGHHSIKTTEKYARASRVKVSRNMVRLNDSLFNEDGSLVSLTKYYGEPQPAMQQQFEL